LQSGNSARGGTQAPNSTKGDCSFIIAGNPPNVKKERGIIYEEGYKNVQISRNG